MEPKAGDDFNHLKKEATERKLSKRRSKIQEMMMEKRMNQRIANEVAKVRRIRETRPSGHGFVGRRFLEYRW